LNIEQGVRLRLDKQRFLILEEILGDKYDLYLFHLKIVPGSITGAHLSKHLVRSRASIPQDYWEAYLRA